MKRWVRRQTALAWCCVGWRPWSMMVRQRITEAMCSPCGDHRWQDGSARCFLSRTEGAGSVALLLSLSLGSKAWALSPKQNLDPENSFLQQESSCGYWTLRYVLSAVSFCVASQASRCEGIESCKLFGRLCLGPWDLWQPDQLVLRAFVYGLGWAF